MQSVNIILIAIVTSLCLPLMLLFLSAYTLYNTISMARYAKRRNEDLFKTLSIGRTLTKSFKSRSTKALNLKAKSTKPKSKSPPKMSPHHKSPIVFKNKSIASPKSPLNMKVMNSPSNMKVTKSLIKPNLVISPKAKPIRSPVSRKVLKGNSFIIDGAKHTTLSDPIKATKRS